MRQLISRQAMKTIFMAAMSTVILSCGGHDDQEIRDDVTKRLQDSYRNVNAEVTNGVVTLTGSCEGNDCAAGAERLIADVPGNDSVRNNIQDITSTDMTLRTSVQTVVSKYQGVKADVVDGNVVLRGTILRDQVQALMSELEMLRPKKIDNQLAIQ